MRVQTVVVTLVIVVATSASALAQAPTDASAAAPSERLTLAVVTNVAVEGSGPWFAPGMRLTVPIGRRAGVDIESSAVFGGRLPAPYGSITSFLALNVRHRRSTDNESPIGRYWLYGARYMPIHRLSAVEPRSYDSDLALTIGHGWDQILSRGRVAAEVGVSGGRGFLVFATLVLGLSR